MEELEIHTTPCQPNNCNSDKSKPAPPVVSEQTEPPLAVTLTSDMEPQLPQIVSVFSEYNQTNDSDYSVLKPVAELNKEQDVTTSKPFPQAAKPELPQIKSVYSEPTAANDSDFNTSEMDASSNNQPVTITAETLTQVMETKNPHIEMVLSEYADGNCGKLESVASSSAELSNRMMETELLLAATAYPECNFSKNSDFAATNSWEDATKSESTKTDPPQVVMVSCDLDLADDTVFCRLETDLSPNREEIVSPTVRNENKIAPSYNECGNLQGCGQNNNSSLTEAVDRELPRISEVFSKQCPLNSALSPRQTEEMEISIPNLFNNICDNLNTPPVPEAATSDNNASTEESTNSEVWKEISIKKEILDDEELIMDVNDSVTSESRVNLTTSVKSELHIKSEEVDIKDVDRIPERKFACKKCDRHFPLECTYRLHVLGHMNIKPIQCDQCSFQCNKKKRMLQHLRNHTGEKRILCKICKESYYPYNEFDHFQKCPKPHKYHCEECEYSTSQKFYYLRHVRLHTGERLKCSRCDMGFLDNVARKKHYKSHTKEKPYQCHICYRRFKVRSARERHVLAYCDRKCPKCDYISIYCTDFYGHVKEFHPFTKLKLNLQRCYRQYEKVLAKNFDQMNTVIHIDPEFVNYGSEQNITVAEFTKCESSQNIDYEAQNIGWETEAKRNTDYELIQNIKYELIENTENYGHHNYESVNLGAEYDYELMQNVKLNLTESAEYVKQNMERGVEENIDYDLIQNVKCELTEGTEDYTLLCL